MAQFSTISTTITSTLALALYGAAITHSTYRIDEPPAKTANFDWRERNDDAIPSLEDLDNIATEPISAWLDDKAWTDDDR